MNTLKKIIICLFITSSISSFSQQKDSITHSLQKGAIALQFEISYDFKLTSFEGAQFSIKYHFSPKFAFRIGAGLNARESNIDLVYKDYYHNSMTINEPLKEHYSGIYLTSALIFYPKPEKLIKFYTGLGPRYSFINSRDEYIYTDGYKGVELTDGWTAGLNLIAGCEWFPVSYISLAAEYSVIADYGVTTKSGEITHLSSNNLEEYYYSQSRDFRFQANSVKLGLGIYF